MNDPLKATNSFTPEGEAALLSAVEASRVVARRYARPGQCVDDLVSVATVRIVEAASKLFAHPTPTAFARVAAQRAVVDHLRRDGRGRRAWDHQPLDELPLPARESREPPPFTLDELLALANASDRELLSLRFRDGLQHDQVAERLGVSRDCVSARLSRALRRLRERVREENQPE